MAETTAQEALLAELLGDVHKLREEVTALAQVVPQARDAIERAGDLVTLKFEKQITRADTVLAERIAQMAAAVKDASATREMLVGAVAVKASEQARAQLLDAVREVVAVPTPKPAAEPVSGGVRRHFDRIVIGLCSAAVASMLTTWIFVRLLSH
ncbi:hypothetical protein LMG19083_04588 [Ralstonia psammae]|uniref:Uncharacterized protein n=1 Tax=Ralstonia psammae TaxID=3058598 RepID=A0ABM9JYP6_9RALS|nr:hypothetical protein [Ralstonia sp. LMG 19083]CAJ0807613.1 hypothetical protein LMG19083_04588 [Ralstonia sp. LMG 19083]